MNQINIQNSRTRREFIRQTTKGAIGFVLGTKFAAAEMASGPEAAGPVPATERTFMKPRIGIITIGVDDLERSLRFYRDGLGLKTEGIVGKEFEYGAVVFFELHGGPLLALFPRKSLSRDCGVSQSCASPTEFSLGHNVSSKAEVDAVMKQAKAAGAVIAKPAHETFWGGYAGYFQDPDQHLWEVLWNPNFLPKE